MANKALALMKKKFNSPSPSEPIWDGFEMSYGNGVGSLLRKFIFGLNVMKRKAEFKKLALILCFSEWVITIIFLLERM